MGLLSAISKGFRGEAGVSSPDKIIGTDEQAITPENAKYGIYRSTPVLKELRAFTIPEATALESLAAEREITSKATKKALRALKTIKSYDTSDQKAFNSYQKCEAELTTQQVESNAQLATNLEQLRSRFGLAHQQVAGAISAANSQQQAIFGNEKKEEFSKLW